MAQVKQMQMMRKTYISRQKTTNMWWVPIFTYLPVFICGEKIQISHGYGDKWTPVTCIISNIQLVQNSDESNSSWFSSREDNVHDIHTSKQGWNAMPAVVLKFLIYLCWISELAKCSEAPINKATYQVAPPSPFFPALVSSNMYTVSTCTVMPSASWNTVHFQTYKPNLPFGQQQLLIPNPKFKTQNSYNSCPGNIASSWQSSGGNKNKRDKLSHLIRVSIAVVLTRIVGDCPAWMYPWEAISGDGHHHIPYQINHKTRHEFLCASNMRNVQWSWWELDRGHGCAHPGMYPRSLSNCSAIITSSLSISTTIGSLFTLDKDGIWQA